MPNDASDFKTLYFDLVEASQGLGCRVNDLLAERDSLKRRLAESESELGDLRRQLYGEFTSRMEAETGAAVLRAVIEKLCACDSKDEAWEEINRAEFEATRHYTGRELLAVMRKCRDVLAECSRPGADDTNYHAVVVHRREALAAMKPFLRDA